MAWSVTVRPRANPFPFLISLISNAGEQCGLFLRDPQTVAAIRAKDPQILDGLIEILDELDAISATMRFGECLYGDDLEEEGDCKLILQSSFFASGEEKERAREALERIRATRMTAEKIERERKAKVFYLRKRRAEFSKQQPILMLSLIERDGYQCKTCGTQDNLSIDHIIPLSKDGTDDLSNLQILCKSCNSIKGDRHE